MSQFVKYLCLGIAAFVALSVPAMAQDGTSIAFSGAFGAGIVMLGAGIFVELEFLDQLLA